MPRPIPGPSSPAGEAKSFRARKFARAGGFRTINPIRFLPARMADMERGDEQGRFVQFTAGFFPERDRGIREKASA